MMLFFSFKCFKRLFKKRQILWSLIVFTWKYSSRQHRYFPPGSRKCLNVRTSGCSSVTVIKVTSFFTTTSWLTSRRCCYCWLRLRNRGAKRVLTWKKRKNADNEEEKCPHKRRRQSAITACYGSRFHTGKEVEKWEENLCFISFSLIMQRPLAMGLMKCWKIDWNFFRENSGDWENFVIR